MKQNYKWGNKATFKGEGGKSIELYFIGQSYDPCYGVFTETPNASMGVQEIYHVRYEDLEDEVGELKRRNAELHQAIIKLMNQQKPDPEIINLLDENLWEFYIHKNKD